MVSDQEKRAEWLKVLATLETLEPETNEVQREALKFLWAKIEEKMNDPPLPTGYFQDGFIDLIWKNSICRVDCSIHHDGDAEWFYKCGELWEGSEAGSEPMTEEFINGLVEKLKLFHG